MKYPGLRGKKYKCALSGNVHDCNNVNNMNDIECYKDVYLAFPINFTPSVVSGFFSEVLSDNMTPL